jgi:maltooligosyltrehalose trehalohydrolase
VILDVVYNHLGPAGNYLGQFGPYFTDRYATPWGEAVNLDGAWSDEVRRFFCDNALMWLDDYRFDGLRIDAVHATYDSSALHFLEQLAREVRALEAASGRPLVLIAESDLNDPKLVRSPDVGGFGLDAQWNEDFHHALHAVMTGERTGYYADFGRVADLAKALEHGFVYDGRYSAFRKRRHGRSAADLSGHRFVGCMQNHDQVGNRAQGERMSRLVSPGRLKVGAAIMLTAPFVPMLFQGEEWGATTPFQYFTSHADPDLGAAVRDGRRAEFAAFGWAPDAIPDPQDEATFARSKLDWRERQREPHAEILEWYRELIRLRGTLADLSDGRLARTRVRFDEPAQWLVIERGDTAIACNLGAETQRIALGGAGGGARDATVVARSSPDVRVADGRAALPPDSVAIVAPRET